MIPTLQQVRQSLPKPKFNTILHNTNGNNGDIIVALKKDIPVAISQTKKLTKLGYFLGKTELETSKNIHQFIREHLGYRRNTKRAQQIFLPSTFVYTSGDCKSNALFVYAILENYYPGKVFMRFVNYNSILRPSHVYSVLKKKMQPLLLMVHLGFSIKKLHLNF
jgi:hypothetical protein